MFEETPRTEHLRSNLLGWAALNHFLPARLVRELSFVMVEVISSGTISLTDLFEEELSGAVDLESWIIRPREVKSPIATYLQHRIQSLVWQNDDDVFFERAESNDSTVSAADVECAVFIGKADFVSGGDLGKDLDRLTEPGIVALLNVLRTAAKAFASEVNSSSVSDELLYINVQSPLKEVLKKHVGDLCGDSDRWEEAFKLYESAQSGLAAFAKEPWRDFTGAISDVILQSKSAAVRIIAGATESAWSLRESFRTTSPRKSHVLLLNASYDQMVAEILGADSITDWKDRRAAILQTPLLLATHDTHVAVERWFSEKFSDANVRFWAVLRRQLALGSAQESRDTKAQYARCLLTELDRMLDRDQRPDAFWSGLRLFVESGKSESAKQFMWSEQLVRSYLTNGVVRNVILHVERHYGARLERASVAIECFARWVPLLSDEYRGLARTLLMQLSDFCTQTVPKRPWTSNIDGRSLEILIDLAQEKPEFNSEVADRVADIISENLTKERWWKVKADTIKLATGYLKSFNKQALLKVIDAVLAVLDTIDPAREEWPIVQPAMELLMSKEFTQSSLGDSALAERIVSTVLRFGLRQKSEHAHLLYYLEEFDIVSIKEKAASEMLDLAIEQVKAQARNVRASNAIYGINALLYASKWTRYDGVQTGLATFNEVLKTVDQEFPAISFSQGYATLNILAERHQVIRVEAGIAEHEFITELKEIFESVIRVWTIAKDRPLIFALFAIPRHTKANATVVHNWAYSSIAFGQAIGRRSEIMSVLAEAEAEPALGQAIALARTTRLAGGESEELTRERIEGESAAAFYAGLGQRLIEILSFDEEDRRLLTDAMLRKVFRDGPRGMDAAVFLAAAQCGVGPSVDDRHYESYRLRLDRQPRDVRLALFPMLDRLERRG